MILQQTKEIAERLNHLVNELHNSQTRLSTGQLTHLIKSEINFQSSSLLDLRRFLELLKCDPAQAQVSHNSSFESPTIGLNGTLQTEAMRARLEPRA